MEKGTNGLLGPEIVITLRDTEEVALAIKNN
jgi:hypothetical protein